MQDSLDHLWSWRFLQQSAALTYKNVLVAWRSRRATIIRLLAPLVFLLLALLIQLSLDANNKRERRIQASEVAEASLLGSIPDCHEDLYIADKPCLTFLYTPNGSAAVQSIINNIKASNEPPITRDKVLGLASRAAADEYMMAHPETVLGAVHFFEEGSNFKYMLQINTTAKAFKGTTQSPVTFFTMPFMSSVAREVSRFQLAAAGQPTGTPEWMPRLLKFPHPQLRSVGMVGYVLGPFIFAACMFGVVTQLALIVSEKEHGLITSLRHMGLLQSSYWTSWVCFDVLMGMITALSIVAWGNVLQFRFFLRNDAGLLVLLFWLFALAMSSFSYFLSVFMSNQQTATYAGFAVFLVGWICQTVVIFGMPYDPESYYAPSGIGKGFFWVFAFMPWCPLIKGCLDLASATSLDKSPGLHWGERFSYCQYIQDPAVWPLHDPTKSYTDYDCTFPIGQCYLTLLAQAGGWLLLAVYLDNVWASGHGLRRPPWYFLVPSYWFRHRTAQQGMVSSSTGSSGQLPSKDFAGSVQELPPRSSGAIGKHAANAGVVKAAMKAAGGVNSGGNGVYADADVAAEAAKMQALLQQQQLQALSPADRSKAIAALARLQQHTASQSNETPSSVHAEDVCDKAVADNIAGQQGWHQSAPSVKYAIMVFGLSKVFKSWGYSCVPQGKKNTHGSKAKLNQRSSRNNDAQGDFWAICGSWFGIEEGQLFCLLGPNGAGKTTTINCLTGILPPSGGIALVCGESISTEGGMDRVRPLTGVCPQFDVLWGELTGLEHLIVAGHVKGLPYRQVRAEALQLLERVQLAPAAAVRSTAYSGGMKRRLSVALALLGDPKVLYLDEPTTGMDPISRRCVWDVIQAAKPGKAIVLTTHSMEEADILGDRIAIMARGSIRAIGSSIRLKHKFGAGYQLVVTLSDASSMHDQSQHGSDDMDTEQRRQQHQRQQDKLTTRTPVPEPHEHEHQHQHISANVVKNAVKNLFAQHMPGLQPIEGSKRSLTYLVPRHQQQELSALLQDLEAATAAAYAKQHDGGQSGNISSLQGDCDSAQHDVSAAALRACDVQLSLTSLEEVFLAIAKQAELEVAAVTGARVEVQLPDTGQQVQIAVGQEWIDAASMESSASSNGPDVAAATGGMPKGYVVKWIQDDFGALTVLSVVPARQAAAGLRAETPINSSSGSRLPAA